MEFLIARGFPDPSAGELKQSLSESVTFKGEKETFTHSDDDFFLFSSGAPLSIDNDANFLYLFDGHVFYKDMFLHTLLDAQGPQVEAVFRALEAKAMNDVSGVFCSARVDLKSKQFTLYCDPFSQYPIASWQSGDRYIVSNNVLLIEKFLQSHQLKLERDPLCMLRNAMTFNVSLTSAYKDVSYPLCQDSCRLT